MDSSIFEKIISDVSSLPSILVNLLKPWINSEKSPGVKFRSFFDTSLIRLLRSIKIMLFSFAFSERDILNSLAELSFSLITDTSGAKIWATGNEESYCEVTRSWSTVIESSSIFRTEILGTISE